jgi:hypothetical protein
VNAKGDIDLKEAYGTGIGDWDKVAITWGYGDYSKEKNEPGVLNKVLADATLKKGLQFISDRDARAAGGLHPQAHLWDNGADAVAELKEVMKVRSVALAHFGEKSIRPGMPMAMLEDVLVPAYLLHRYQLEAVTKIIGGMYYTYALRGDGQVVTRTLTRDEQLKALQAVIDCIDPRLLVLPESITKLIPPRPAGYDFTRELFKKRTGLAFDALAPAETAADFPLSFLFNSERLSRMAQYEVSGGLGVHEMLRVLLAQTWKADRRTGMEAMVQLQTEQIVLTYLMALATDESASFAARAAGQKALADLKTFIEEQKNTAKEESYLAHLMLALERMKAPDKAKPAVQHKEMPPGAPIGCDMDDQ